MDPVVDKDSYLIHVSTDMLSYDYCHTSNSIMPCTVRKAISFDVKPPNIHLQVNSRLSLPLIRFSRRLSSGSLRLSSRNGPFGLSGVSYSPSSFATHSLVSRVQENNSILISVPPDQRDESFDLDLISHKSYRSLFPTPEFNAVPESDKSNPSHQASVGMDAWLEMRKEQTFSKYIQQPHLSVLENIVGIQRHKSVTSDISALSVITEEDDIEEVAEAQRSIEALKGVITELVVRIDQELQNDSSSFSGTASFSEFSSSLPLICTYPHCIVSKATVIQIVRIKKQLLDLWMKMDRISDEDIYFVILNLDRQFRELCSRAGIFFLPNSFSPVRSNQFCRPKDPQHVDILEKLEEYQVLDRDAVGSFFK